MIYNDNDSDINHQLFQNMIVLVSDLPTVQIWPPRDVYLVIKLEGHWVYLAVYVPKMRFIKLD